MEEGSEADVVLDKEAFGKAFKVKALRVPCHEVSAVRQLLKTHLLSMKRIRPVQSDTGETTKLLLLNEASSSTLPREIHHLTEREDVALIDYEIRVSYEHLSAAEVLGRLLPETVAVPTAFESVGHIAHLNLRPEHEPFKRAIGEVLLDKNPSIQTVINKVGRVENEFRLMEVEVLAGEPSLETEVKQGACRFQLDFGKVYWNSRLEFEHDRLVRQFLPGETVLDLMAGIGPFAIPAAKKGCVVVANDKNPESYKYLCRNIVLNKVMGAVLPFNLDARFCLRVVLGLEGTSLTDHLPPNYAAEVERLKKERRKKQKQRNPEQEKPFVVPSVPLRCHHVVMNYPQYAIEFLDMFRDVFDSGSWMASQMPRVHCYTFMRVGEDEDTLKAKCEEMLGVEIEPQVHIVRDVAPSKVMCCISFQLPRCIAVTVDAEDVDETKDAPIAKKQKCNNDND